MILDCFSGVDQTKYSLDMFTSNSQTVNLTEAAAVSVFLDLKGVLCCLGQNWYQGFTTDPIHFTFLPFGLSWTLTHRKTHRFTSDKLTLTHFFALMQRRQSWSSLLCLVWFSIWFGNFRVCNSTLCFLLFVCHFFFLPRQSVSLSNKNLEAKFSQYFFQPPDKNL